MKNIFFILLLIVSALGTASAYDNNIDQYYQQMWGNFDPHAYQQAWDHNYGQQQAELPIYDVQNTIGRAQTQNCKVYAGSPVGYDYFRTFGLRIPYEWQHISMYRIKWYNGSWSKWYKLGQDDINQYPYKFGYPVRIRANFDDHDYEYMICENNSDYYKQQYQQRLYNEYGYRNTERQWSNYIQQQEQHYYNNNNTYQQHYSAPRYQFQGTTTNRSDSVRANPDNNIDLDRLGFPGDGNYYGRIYFENPNANSPRINIPNYGNDYINVPLR